MMSSKRQSQIMGGSSEIQLQVKRSDSRKEVSTSPESPSRKQEFQRQLKSQDRAPTILARVPPQVKSENKELRKAIEACEEELSQRQQELKLLEQSKMLKLATIKSSKLKKASQIATLQAKLTRIKDELFKSKMKLKTLDVDEISQQNKSDNAIRQKQSQISKVKKRLIEARWNEECWNDSKKWEDQLKQQEQLREALSQSQKMIQDLTLKNVEVTEKKMKIDWKCQELHDQLWEIKMQNQALEQKLPKRRESRNQSSQEQERSPSLERERRASISRIETSRYFRMNQ